MRLIDAEHLERWLEQVLSNANPLDRKARNAFSECLTKMKSMPTIEAEPTRHGCVIVHEGREDDYYEKCSVCGSWEVNKFDFYCPTCGAKMDLKEDNHAVD